MYVQRPMQTFSPKKIYLRCRPIIALSSIVHGRQTQCTNTRRVYIHIMIAFLLSFRYVSRLIPRGNYPDWFDRFSTRRAYAISANNKISFQILALKPVLLVRSPRARGLLLHRMLSWKFHSPIRLPAAGGLKSIDAR